MQRLYKLIEKKEEKTKNDYQIRLETNVKFSPFTRNWYV